VRLGETSSLAASSRRDRRLCAICAHSSGSGRTAPAHSARQPGIRDELPAPRENDNPELTLASAVSSGPIPWATPSAPTSARDRIRGRPLAISTVRKLAARQEGAMVSFPRSPAYVAPCHWLQARQRLPGPQSDPAVAWAQEHHAQVHYTELAADRNRFWKVAGSVPQARIKPIEMHFCPILPGFSGRPHLN
jgi:hypothetical protein